ncbi:MAG: transcription termination factor NusA [Solitalea-like symbiont of Acarus siro]
MQKINLIDSFKEFKYLKNIDKESLTNMLEDLFRSIVKKKYSTDSNFDVIVNYETGDLEIWRTRKVVKDLDIQDDNLDISLSEAQKNDPNLKIGDDIIEPITLESFGRRIIATAKQTLASRLHSLEKELLIKKYAEKIGELIVGEVKQIWKRTIFIIDDEGNELVLPRHEQIPADFYKKGDTIRAVVLDIENQYSINPKVILSRTAPGFLHKLLELEVPEIYDGLIIIKNIVREPGERSKVAVESLDDRIDPVGACVGMKGSRIHNIVKELRNENIDIINFTTNTNLYIQRAMSPARIEKIKIEDNKAELFLRPGQISVAIGKNGQNIKLAGRLTGYEINIYRETENEEDVDLDEFSDEIDVHIIEKLKMIGCDTAKSVLKCSPEYIESKIEVDKSIVDNIFKILKAEF